MWSCSRSPTGLGGKWKKWKKWKKYKFSSFQVGRKYNKLVRCQSNCSENDPERRVHITCRCLPATSLNAPDSSHSRSSSSAGSCLPHQRRKRKQNNFDAPRDLFAPTIEPLGVDERARSSNPSWESRSKKPTSAWITSEIFASPGLRSMPMCSRRLANWCRFSRRPSVQPERTRVG
jgi:hypothetical protein